MTQLTLDYSPESLFSNAKIYRVGKLFNGDNIIPLAKILNIKAISPKKAIEAYMKLAGVKNPSAVQAYDDSEHVIYFFSGECDGLLVYNASHLYISWVLDANIFNTAYFNFREKWRRGY